MSITMLPRLGLAVRSRTVAAVLVRGHRCMWQNHTVIEQNESFGSAVARLLGPLPRTRGWRPRVVVAIGPHAVQTKRLEGLPVVAQQRLLVAAVRENVAAMFLQQGGTLVVPSVARTAQGAPIGAAYDLAVLREISEALAMNRLRLTSAVPTVVALAALAPNHSFVWSDESDRIHMGVTSKGGELRDVTRLSEVVAAERRRQSPIPGALNLIATENVDAYAAAVLRRRPALEWRPERGSRRSKMLHRLRITTTAASVAVASLSALLAPGYRARGIASRSAAELTRTRDQQIELARTSGGLRRTTDILDRVERFRAQRGGLTLVLGALSQTLPESTAIVSLRLDTLEGSFVSLAAHAVDILPELSGVSGIAAPRLVGSVTREMVGTTRLERATFRFRRQAALPMTMSRSSTSLSARERGQ